jgi:hypothetical protein
MSVNNLQRYKRIKALRKLHTARQRVKAQQQEKVSVGKVIEKYRDFGSEAYAPITRTGNVPDAKTAKIEVRAKPAPTKVKGAKAQK